MNNEFAHNPMYETLKRNDARTGQTLRIRLPSNCKVNPMETELTNKERFQREQRLQCVDFALKLHSKEAGKSEIIVDTAKRLYKFVKKGK